MSIHFINPLLSNNRYSCFFVDRTIIAKLLLLFVSVRCEMKNDMHDLLMCFSTNPTASTQAFTYHMCFHILDLLILEVNR